MPPCRRKRAAPCCRGYGGHAEVHIIALERTQMGIIGDHEGQWRSSVNVNGRLPFKVCHS